MSVFWLILALFTLAGDATSIYMMAKSKIPAGAVEYAAAAGSLLLGIGVLYGAIVEGFTLAYIIIAWGVLNAIRGIYSLSTKSWIMGGISLAFGLLFIYWGWQRYSMASAALLMPTFGGRRRYSRRR